MSSVTSCQTTEVLGSYKIRKYLESVYIPYNDSPVPSPAAEMKVLLILAENSWKTEVNLSRCELFHMKTKVSL